MNAQNIQFECLDIGISLAVIISINYSSALSISLWLLSVITALATLIDLTCNSLMKDSIIKFLFLSFFFHEKKIHFIIKFKLYPQLNVSLPSDLGHHLQSFPPSAPYL